MTLGKKIATLVAGMMLAAAAMPAQAAVSPSCFTKDELAARADLRKIPKVMRYIAAHQKDLGDIAADLCWQRAVQRRFPKITVEVDYVVPEPLPPEIDRRARGNFYGVLTVLALPEKQHAPRVDGHDPIADLIARFKRAQRNVCFGPSTRHVAARTLQDPQIKREFRVVRTKGRQHPDFQLFCREMKAVQLTVHDIPPGSTGAIVHRYAEGAGITDAALLAAMAERVIKRAAK